jgi:hypothetical protein
LREPSEDSTGFFIRPAAIINQIKTLLKERYKEGFPIIKEIIQNANDGGATRLDIGVSRGFSGASHPLLQCPALFFVNDGGFSDSDAQAIRWFGVDINATDSAKIGKFGLGQKSIFHFCEAFFYIARSESLSDNPYRWQFLNPWAGPTDPKRPAWKQLIEVDKEIVESYLRTQTLLGKQYFILWIPLRVQEADNRCILANYYNDRSIRDHLPKDMDTKIAALLPMLRSLREVRYWLPDDEGQLQEEFHVRLDGESAERCSYPKSGEESHPEIERSLFGRISLAQTSFAIYAGREAILAAKKFHSLLPHSDDRTLDFWDDLKRSEYWPKRSTEDEEGNALSVPDKAIPHCAVVFSRKVAQGEGSLTIQWAVFLPLVDGESDVAEFEHLECEGNWDYTLLLHGYFFLDSGRRYIEALKEICEGTVSRNLPQNENQMVWLWNTILASAGILSNLLPAVDEFCRRHQLDERDIATLCASLRKTKIFRRGTCQEYLYTDFCWVYQLRPEHSAWQLTKKTQKVLALPSILEGMWSAFPELRRCAEDSCLVWADSPNLLPSNKPDSWEEAKIQAILRSLNVKNVFAKAECIEFLVNLLKSWSNPLSTEIQGCLKDIFKQAFLQVEIDNLAQVRDSIARAIALLDECRWFKLACDDANLLQVLQQENLDILLIPKSLAPRRQTSLTISGHDAGLLIIRLVEHRADNFQDSNQIIRQIIDAVHSQEITALREHVDNLEFVRGFDCRGNNYRFYSPAKITAVQRQGWLFEDSLESRKVADDLQAALRSEPVVLVDRELATKLCGEGVRTCDRAACLKVLRQKPELSDVENRTNLLYRLLQ